MQSLFLPTLSPTFHENLPGTAPREKTCFKGKIESLCVKYAYLLFHASRELGQPWLF